MHKRRRCTMPKLLLVNDLHISKSAATSEKMWVMTRDSSHGQGMAGGSRRVATLDSHQTQVFSSVATRRELFSPSSPWTEVHGYLQCVAPRHDESDSTENSGEPEGGRWESCRLKVNLLVSCDISASFPPPSAGAGPFSSIGFILWIFKSPCCVMPLRIITSN